MVSLLDWGIGGVDLLARLHAARPDLRLRYRSDAGFLPWGRVPPAALADRVATLVRQERGAGASAVLLACNAASTALGALRSAAVDRLLPHGLHGVIEPGVAALLARPPTQIAVLGGARTIRSGAWSRPLRRGGHAVRGRVAQALSARIEAGDVDGPQTRALVARLCAPLVEAEVAVLACTHYPAAHAAFAAALPGVRLFDPAEAALAALLAALPAPASSPALASPSGLSSGVLSSGVLSTGVLSSGASTWQVFTSGDPDATRRAAQRAFGIDLGVVAAWTAADA